MADKDPEADKSSIFDLVVQADRVGLKEALSTKQVDLEARDSAGRTALHLAVIAGTAEICQYLIDHGANLDSWTGQGEAVVHLAAKRGDVDILRTVMESVSTEERKIQSEDEPSSDKRDPNVHVDSLTKKYRMSPLYIAVALAHVTAAEALLTTYHANANIIAGEDNSQRGTRTAHVLEAALQHPRDVCRPLITMLLQHGASLLDPSKETISPSLLLLALKRDEDVLDIFVELDNQNFMAAIKKSVWLEMMSCLNTLTMAIEYGLENTALKLLKYGAPPQLEFNSSLDIVALRNPFGKNLEEGAKNDFWQPILKAAMKEMPRLMIDLLNRGADPNSTLTEHQAQYMLHHRECRTVLDIVKAKLMELRNWKKDEETATYDIRGTPEEAKQIKGKEDAVSQLVKEYEAAEAKLVSMGAKISDGLNLQELPTPVSIRPNKRLQLYAPSSSEADTQTQQQSGELDFRKIETLEDGHQALFSACREGNAALVKALTLGRWGPDLKFPPILISAVSGYSKGPFLTAVESRNYEIARTVVQIATVQQAGLAENEKNDLYNALADDQHPVESIKDALGEVQSTVPAKKIVFDSGSCFAGEIKKDVGMLRFSIEMESSVSTEQSDFDRRIRHAWALVEHGDWPEAFEEYVRATGGPFKHVVSQGKLKGKSQLDRLHQLSPLLQAAWSGNLDMVRFFLNKDRAMAAYKHFAENHDFTTRKAGPEQSRAEFITAVEKWLDNRHNLVLHCAIVSRNIELVKFVLSARPELLEVQSIDGWTPLMTAAIHQRIEALLILLEAGANPLATDPYGRNMLHLLLFGPTGNYVLEPEKLASVLRCMDRSLLHQLLEQRCNESPGGQTPLARLISNRPPLNAVLTALLEISNMTPLEMLDGAGYTPLHIVTNSSMENLIRPVIEKAPHVMFYEDPQGRTPLDVAIDKQLHGFIECFMSSYARIKEFPASSPLLHWPLFAFGTDYSGPFHTRDPYRTWEISQELANALGSQRFPRKLVTQTQREEVAKWYE
ncbi:ankyrin repeat protein [Trichoderma harzianum]|uniref:Ankyrin repeat protein n=1 Tax=Trichoderma harzianum TaxID=5544 RepID=A0A0F9X696_TRIHA|nr:ankyrin repeat protein [Trichoderma harzianum]